MANKKQLKQNLKKLYLESYGYGECKAVILSSNGDSITVTGETDKQAVINATEIIKRWTAHEELMQGIDKSLAVLNKAWNKEPEFLKELGFEKLFGVYEQIIKHSKQ